VTFCNGKGEVKAAHPCFERWGSTIGFLIRGFQNHLDSGVNSAHVRASTQGNLTLELGNGPGS